MGFSRGFLGDRQRTGADIVKALFGVLLVAGGALLLQVSCQVHSPQPTLLPDGGDACNAMCTNERALNASDPCPGFTGNPSPAGTTCEVACRAQDPIYNLHSVCVAQATSCAAMKACYTN